jgi:hypothetical protein
VMGCGSKLGSAPRKELMVLSEIGREVMKADVTHGQCSASLNTSVALSGRNGLEITRSHVTKLVVSAPQGR